MFLDHEAQVASYLQNKKILIVDKNAAVRSRMMEILKEMGARWANIDQVGDAASAEAKLRERHPEVLVCEYRPGGASGIDLVHLHNKEAGGSGGRLSVMVSRNAQPSAIAEAVEAGVDCFVLKPFTSEAFRGHLRKTILAKLAAGPYQRVLDKGVAALEAGKLEEAELMLRGAAELGKPPVLALYYLGVLALRRGDNVAARKSFEQGLAASPNHFLCLLGLFDLHRKAVDDPAAYAAALRVMEKFPLSPQRLGEVLGLSLRLGKFDKLNGLYKAYLDTSQRSPELVSSMIAALIAGGRQAVENGETARGFDLFQNAVVSSGRSLAVIREAILPLLHLGYWEYAQKLLSETPQEARSGTDYLALAYLVSASSGPPEGTLEQGLKLVREEVYHPDIYRTLIEKAVALGKAKLADQQAHDAARRWPDLREDFLRLLG